jgi:hypothetical protein
LSPTPGRSGEAHSDRPGSEYRGPQVPHSRQPGLRQRPIFHFQYDPGHNRFLFSGNKVEPQYGAAHVFKTVSVPAVSWYDVPGNGGEQAPAVGSANFEQILGCQSTGANFMVTTQFTGCAFCWTSDNGGVVRAAHIGPTKPGYPADSLATSYPGRGNALALRMITQGQAPPLGVGVAAGMANTPDAPLRVFGRGAGNVLPVAAGNVFYPNANLNTRPSSDAMLAPGNFTCRRSIW